MSNLTKRELVSKISAETGLIQQDVMDVVQKTLEYITTSLASGQNVELRNFGVFEVRMTKPKIGRNPNEPDTEIPIPARATVKFKAGKVMREKVLPIKPVRKKTPSAAASVRES